MGKSNFDNLMSRYLRNEVTEEEKVRIEAWLDVMKTEEGTDLELSREDEEKLYLKIVAGFPPKNARRWRISVELRSMPFIIASAIVVLAISFFLRNGEPGTNKLILNDGSLVWLKEGSNLIYFENADGTRRAALTGSGLFEVSKDPARPFILQSGDYTIRVLGTSFSVLKSQDGIELEVLTGKVNLSSKTDSTGIIVGSNKKVFYNGRPDAVATDLSPGQISQLTQDTQYDMKFSNASMGAVIGRLEKKFDVTVTVGNKHIEDCKITADFTDRSLENTLLMISEVLPIEYNINLNKVVISGDGCK